MECLKPDIVALQVNEEGLRFARDAILGAGMSVAIGLWGRLFDAIVGKMSGDRVNCWREYE